MTLTFIQVYSYMRKKCVLIYSQSSQSILMKSSMLPQPAGLLRLMLNMFHMINIQVREPTYVIL